MQDRFKFRAYNKLLKKFTYFDKPRIQFAHSASEYESGLIFPLAKEQKMYLGHYEEIQQCTGLKDKNGTLIYEGDIVFKKGSKRYNGKKMYSRVIFNEMYAAFNISDENGMHQMPTNSNNVEVISNIYDNKELLNERN